MGHFALPQLSQYHLDLFCPSKRCSTGQEIVSYMVCGEGEIKGESCCNSICYLNTIKIAWQKLFRRDMKCKKKKLAMVSGELLMCLAVRN